jgi:methylenetetrahydrofolate dehydrogenase (NADP+)/methenyltetrahydrofolate cyclohydrolase
VILTKIIDGKKIAANILSKLKADIKECAEIPKLAIILIGENPASLIYVNTKIKQAAFVGIQTELISLSVDVSQADLISIINDLNNAPEVKGIIIQLPIPKNINFENLTKHIDPRKDVDGFHPLNVGKLHSNTKDSQDNNFYFVPCTALACLEAIKSVIPNLKGQNIVIVNRSNLIGKPLSALLLQQNATVTICHSASVNLRDITQKADIVICAIGQPKFFNKSYFKKGSIIIDVGISRQYRNEKSYISGDVDFDDLIGHASYITPVPGGIGPLTVAYLLSNTISSLKQGN